MLLFHIHAISKFQMHNLTSVMHNIHISDLLLLAAVSYIFRCVTHWNFNSKMWYKNNELTLLCMKSVFPNSFTVTQQFEIVSNWFSFNQPDYYLDMKITLITWRNQSVHYEVTNDWRSNYFLTSLVYFS